MELAGLFVSILAFIFIGWNILFLVSFRKNSLSRPESVCISYGFGIGFVSLEMFLINFLNIKFTPINILMPWLALFAVNCILYFKSKSLRATELSEAIPTKIASSPAAPRNDRLVMLRIFLFFGIGFEAVYAVFRALIKPMESYDAVAIYAIKAKIFYLVGMIPADFFNRLCAASQHLDYPLGIPLAETFVYMCLGNLNDQLVKIIFPLYFICILAVLYFAIRRFSTKTYALLFTFLLATVPQVNAYAANGYLDLPLAYYCFLSALFLFLWFKDRANTQFLLISAIASGLAGWTKNEGLMYCAVNMLLLAIFLAAERRAISRKDLPSLAAYPAIICAISFPWLITKKLYHLANVNIGSIGMSSFDPVKWQHKVIPIIYEFQKEFFGPKKWDILWPIAFLVLAFRFRKIFSGLQKYISFFLIFTVLGYISIYMVAGDVEIKYFLSKTWSRFLIHFTPLVVYWIAYSLREDMVI